MPGTDASNKVIIIGAGVAGLTAGSYLARKGFQVKVLEANPKIGGCCGATEIDGYTFNDGAQYLIYPKLLDLVFSQLGFERAELLPLRRVAAPRLVYLPGGVTVSIDSDLSVRVEQGDVDVSLAQRELAQLIRKWAPVDEILTDEEFMLSPFSAWKVLSRAWRHLPNIARTLKRELELSFSNPLFRSAMAAQLLYAGAPLNRLPAVSIVALVNELKEGTALPQGGMGAIPKALAYTLQQHGGEILLDARVEQIRLRNGRACGVQVERQGFMPADFVLSTVTAMATYGYLLEQPDRPPRLIQRIERTPLSMSAFCIQLGLSNQLDVTHHISCTVPMMEELDMFFQPGQDQAGWGYTSIPTVIAPELAPDGKSILEYVPAIRSDGSTESWNEQRIHDLADASIEWLRSRHVLDIEVKRVRSPREFERELNLYRGAIYGVSAAKGLTGLFPHRSPIDGLYLAGQTTYPGLGIPTAALSGIHASRALMQRVSDR